MGNFVGWFERSYKGIIVALVAIMAIMLVVLAMQHVSASRPAEGAKAGPIPTFSSTPDPRPLASFLGDSYTFGYGAESTTTTLPWLISHAMNWRPDVHGVSSTGYLAESKAGGDTFADRAGTVKADADYVVVMGGVNDASSFPAHRNDYPGIVGKTLDAAQAAAPGAKLVVVGPLWPYAPGDGNIGAMNDIVREQANQHDAIFIDALQAGWMSQPAVKDHMLADKLHPNQDGYNALAADISGALKQQIR